MRVCRYAKEFRASFEGVCVGKGVGCIRECADFSVPWRKISVGFGRDAVGCWRCTQPCTDTCELQNRGIKGAVVYAPSLGHYECMIGGLIYSHPKPLHILGSHVAVYQSNAQ